MNTVTQVKLLFGSGWSWGTLGLVASLLALAAALSYAQVRTERTTRLAAGLGLLRALTLWALLFTLAKPILKRQMTTYEPAYLAVAVDTSQSMSLPATASEDFGSRLAWAEQLLYGPSSYSDPLPRSEVGARPSSEGGLLAAWNGKFCLRLYRFDTQASLVPRPSSLKLLAEGEATDVKACLQAIGEDVPPKHLAGIVLFTDGAENCNPPEQVVQAAAQLGVPVYTVGLGTPLERVKEPPDLSLVAVSTSQTAIAGSTVRVRALVRARGLAQPASVTLTLREGPQVLASQKLNLAPSHPSAGATLEFPAGRVGTHRYALLVAPVPGEVDKDNNTEMFTLTVKDPKVRVLYVEGRLRWDYKFLRRILNSDPNVRLTCLIHTGPDKLYQQDAPTAGPTFPPTLAALAAYDVVILGDIARTHFSREQLESLRRFVADRGGGLVLLGGATSLGPMGFGGTPLARALPVQWGRGSKVAAEFSLSVTSRGRTHPVFSGFSVAGLPALDVGYHLGAPKPGATVLAVGPGGRPLIVAQNYGKGKTLLIAAEGFWHWDFGGGGHTPYTKFWGQALRWLYTPQEKEPSGPPILELYPVPREVAVGETIPLKVAVYRSDYQPENHARPQARIVNPAGQTSTVAFTRIPGTPGLYETAFLPDRAGEYKVSLILRGASRASAPPAKVRAKERELLRAGLNEPFLRQLAAKTGGRYLPASEAAALAAQIPEKKIATTRVEKRPLWATPWLFLAVVVLLTGEWAWRRRQQWV